MTALVIHQPARRATWDAAPPYDRDAHARWIQWQITGETS